MSSSKQSSEKPKKDVIRVLNIFHMLAYYYRDLDAQGYLKVNPAEFDTLWKLLASLLCKFLESQRKRQPMAYVLQEDVLSSVRGKIDLAQSIKSLSIFKRRLYCQFDEFSANSKINQIIKSSLLLLLRKPNKGNDVDGNIKDIREALQYLDIVDSIDLGSVNWSSIRYDRNNVHYRVIVDICHFVYWYCLPITDGSEVSIRELYRDVNMPNVFEGFVREFYKVKRPKLSPTGENPNWIKGASCIRKEKYFPKMKTDTMLERVVDKDKRLLIIDTKYYADITHSEGEKLSSTNLYQIFSYVKNKQKTCADYRIRGCLLYAKPRDLKEENNPNGAYIQFDDEQGKLPCKESFEIVVLDLDQDFKKIEETLLKIAKNFFCEDPPKHLEIQS